MLSVAATLTPNGTSEDQNPNKAAKSGPVAKKTPIALLHEMCSKRKLGIKPEYTIQSMDGPVHAAEFTVQVQLGDMVATGTDGSKQRARQAAALNLLLNLIGVGWEVLPGLQPHLAAEYVKSLMPEPVAATPNKKRGGGASSAGAGGDADNGPQTPSPVSQLNELCMRQRWPLPVFEIREEAGGVPKNREYSATARIGGFEQTASATSKKEAKKLVAEKLLSLVQGNVTADHLQNMRVDQNITAEVLKAMTDLVAARQGHEEIKPSVVLKIQDGLRAAAKNRGKGSSGSECVMMLAKVLDRSGFRATVHDIEKKPESTEFDCLYQLEIPFKLVCYGSGDTLELARNNAAKAALHYLKLVATKNEE